MIILSGTLQLLVWCSVRKMQEPVLVELRVVVLIPLRNKTWRLLDRSAVLILKYLDFVHSLHWLIRLFVRIMKPVDRITLFKVLTLADDFPYVFIRQCVSSLKVSLAQLGL